MAAEVLGRFGQVDVLVNSAFPLTPKRRVIEMDLAALEEWRRAVEVGGFGTLLACRFLAPHMVERGRGAIVNITSMSSRIGHAGRSEYSTGKAQAHKIAHTLGRGARSVRCPRQLCCSRPHLEWTARAVLPIGGEQTWHRLRGRARGAHDRHGPAAHPHRGRGCERRAVLGVGSCIRHHGCGTRREHGSALHALTVRLTKPSAARWMRRCRGSRGVGARRRRRAIAP